MLLLLKRTLSVVFFKIDTWYGHNVNLNNFFFIYEFYLLLFIKYLFFRLKIE